ncbi:MAG TPA: PEP-CTERM sorting domain-containing protein [Opitutaceae bacterium]|nr:PEP-CTERM sorting domain-containing protein [Opitutaceae bacterium]
MKTKYIISALLAMAGLATGAKAISSSFPDLVVGFQDKVAADNLTSDYEIDLGSMAGYVNLAPNTTINLTSTLGLNSGTNLSNIFTSSWNTSGNVTWAALATVGTSGTIVPGAAAYTDWVSQFDTNYTGPINPWQPPGPALYTVSIATSVKTGREGKIAALYSGVSGATATGLGAHEISISNTDANSYSIYANSSTNQFSSTLDSGTGLNSALGTYSVIDLYEYNPNIVKSRPGVYLGSLELNVNDGSLFYTNFVPVPEPSSYAAVLGAAALGFVMLRRCKQQLRPS